MAINRLLVFCLSLLLVIVPDISFARGCGDVLQADMLNQCLGRELADADRDLNAAYARLQRKLKSADKALLKSARTAWLAGRDRDCEFEVASVDGGTAYQPTYLSCQAEATKIRTRQIRRWEKMF